LQARFLAQCLEYEKRSSRHAFWDTGELLANAMAVATMLGSGQSLHVAFVDTQVAGAVEIMRNYVDVSDWVPLGFSRRARRNRFAPAAQVWYTEPHRRIED